MPFAAVDPEWDGGERSVSATKLDELRELLTTYLQVNRTNQDDLINKVIPTMPLEAVPS